MSVVLLSSLIQTYDCDHDQDAVINTLLFLNQGSCHYTRQFDVLRRLVPRLLLSPLLLADRSCILVPEHECGGALVSSSLL
jgi:hypothetical protein